MNVDLSVVEWSRLQFALTAIYHWLFVPLTIGLGFIMAFMETLYVRTGNEEWKRITKFWMKLFGVNFAIGIATGLILEFEFGTNWSNYSWFVGDIFGAPLAIEGIFAFFIEATFFAVMFFGWKKVSKRAHLVSTWMVAIGATLSAFWILVANGWMQNPVGMHFNPVTARNEMYSFWEVVSNPSAVNKFFHTVFSCFVLGSVFVLGVSAWFLLKKREIVFAEKSIKVASVFGLIMAVLTIITGDLSGNNVAKTQPMKLAAMEALYDGKEGAGLSMIGMLKPVQKPSLPQEDVFYFNFEIPKMLSFLGARDFNAFVPGINDLVYGNAQENIISAKEKIQRGKVAIETLRQFKEAQKAKNEEEVSTLLKKFDRTTEEGKLFHKEYFRYFGYGYLNAPEDIVPNVPMTYYSFRIMVASGFWFVLLFAVALFLIYKKKLQNAKVFHWLALLSIPLVYISSQCGWIVAEVGRQPWAIQDLMPTIAAVSRVDASAVQITFTLFAVLFTALLIAEIRILTKQIKIGPKKGGNE